ncbi:hypothetical protein Rhopal_007081-T1 [Rhodotorula paludigena]|uniref:Myb-like domain-containing protein n=1 Tax=Rhodotorula paludigena TaxID=86838 RepID=A0AAV5GUT2_9BASI|nr:hypothetical protein Rhopal_007081-T1 [Rhodotorula paludigena]
MPGPSRTASRSRSRNRSSASSSSSSSSDSSWDPAGDGQLVRSVFKNRDQHRSEDVDAVDWTEVATSLEGRGKTARLAKKRFGELAFEVSEALIDLEVEADDDDGFVPSSTIWTSEEVDSLLRSIERVKTDCNRMECFDTSDPQESATAEATWRIIHRDFCRSCRHVRNPARSDRDLYIKYLSHLGDEGYQQRELRAFEASDADLVPIGSVKMLVKTVVGMHGDVGRDDADWGGEVSRVCKWTVARHKVVPGHSLAQVIEIWCRRRWETLDDLKVASVAQRQQDSTQSYEAEPEAPISFSQQSPARPNLKGIRAMYGAEDRFQANVEGYHQPLTSSKDKGKKRAASVDEPDQDDCEQDGDESATETNKVKSRSMHPKTPVKKRVKVQKRERESDSPSPPAYPVKGRFSAPESKRVAELTFERKLPAEVVALKLNRKASSIRSHVALLRDRELKMHWIMGKDVKPKLEEKKRKRISPSATPESSDTESDVSRSSIATPRSASSSHFSSKARTAASRRDRKDSIKRTHQRKKRHVLDSDESSESAASDDDLQGWRHGSTSFESAVKREVKRVMVKEFMPALDKRVDRTIERSFDKVEHRLDAMTDRLGHVVAALERLVPVGEDLAQDILPVKKRKRRSFSISFAASGSARVAEEDLVASWSSADDAALAQAVASSTYPVALVETIDWNVVLEKLPGRRRTRRQVEGLTDALSYLDDDHPSTEQSLPTDDDALAWAPVEDAQLVSAVQDFCSPGSESGWTIESLLAKPLRSFAAMQAWTTIKAAYESPLASAPSAPPEPPERSLSDLFERFIIAREQISRPPAPSSRHVEPTHTRRKAAEAVIPAQRTYWSRAEVSRLVEKVVELGGSVHRNAAGWKDGIEATTKWMQVAHEVRKETTLVDILPIPPPLSAVRAPVSTSAPAPSAPLVPDSSTTPELSSVPARITRSWTAEEDAVVIADRKKCVTQASTAKTLRRSIGSVSGRVTQLRKAGLFEVPKRGHTDEDRKPLLSANDELAPSAITAATSAPAPFAPPEALPHGLRSDSTLQVLPVVLRTTKAPTDQEASVAAMRRSEIAVGTDATASGEKNMLDSAMRSLRRFIALVEKDETPERVAQRRRWV